MIPDEFQELRRDEGHSLGVVEPETTSKALLGKEACSVQGKLLQLSWGEVHDK